MSLDNFGVKSTKKKEPPKKKSSKPKKSSVSKESEEIAPIITPEIEMSQERKKFTLKCSSKCGYMRTLKKKSLSDEDYVCRKCGETMKLIN